jgi:HEAT repeat protein
MGLIIVVGLVAAGIIWWLKGQQAASLNERTYLRSRGYDDDAAPGRKAGVAQEARLRDLMDSLDDVTPYSRERAAEELALMCESGEKDERMLAPLVTALEDRNPSVRGAAALALGALGDARAISHLERILKEDESPHARAQARRALDKLQPQTAPLSSSEDASPSVERPN